MKCPFVYTTGKRCNGYISEIKIIKANVGVSLDEKDKVRGLSIDTHYHIHLYCSEKSSHAGSAKPHSEQMKIRFSDLPETIRKQIATLEDNNLSKAKDHTQLKMS